MSKIKKVSNLKHARRFYPNLGDKAHNMVFILIIGIMMVCGYWWFFKRDRVYTDNAVVAAAVTTISSMVPGTILNTVVTNDDKVIKGDILLQLDPTDYQVIVDTNSSDVASAEYEYRISDAKVVMDEQRTAALVRVAESEFHLNQAQENEAHHQIDVYKHLCKTYEAKFTESQREFRRSSNLFKGGAVPKQQREITNTEMKKAKAQLNAMKAQISMAQSRLAVTVQNVKNAQAQLDIAKAGYQQVEAAKYELIASKAKLAQKQADRLAAELNLSYCIIKAPISGYIANKRVQIGETVYPGQKLMSIIPIEDSFVRANFQESQIKDIHIGQPAKIKADIHPNYTYYGKVASIGSTTTSAFSLLPAENSSGWIKVSQRVPVKIVFDSPPLPEYILQIGSSLQVTVYTTDKTGPVLLPLCQDEIAQQGQRE